MRLRLIFGQYAITVVFKNVRTLGVPEVSCRCSFDYAGALSSFFELIVCPPAATAFVLFLESSVLGILHEPRLCFSLRS